MIADASTFNLNWGEIFQSSLAAGLLIYFITQIKPTIELLSKDINRNTKATLLSIVANEHVHVEMKRQIQDCIDENEKRLGTP
jgi:hypothetical protein